MTFVVTATTAAGQTNTAEIFGVVRDAQGGVLPGVTIVARQVESGVRVERVTDDQGRYRFPSLVVGTYTVTGELAGFKRVVHAAITLALGAQVQLDLALDVGGIAEEVTVTGGAPLLQTANAEISDVIENREVVQLPLNGRNFLALAQLSDAVVIPPGGTRGDALQQAGPLPNVGGQRSGHNIYLLDGAKVTDELFNNLVINPSVDSIQEFKIQKSHVPGGVRRQGVGADQRRDAGPARTRSAAACSSSIRNDAFDAHNYFDPRDQPVPPLRQNQFGGALGGPLRARPELLLRQLRGAARSPLADAHVLGADRRPSAPATSPASRRSAIR